MPEEEKNDKEMDFKPEQLYILILEAESLTDDQKRAYINRLNEEGITDTLAKELIEIFAKEEQRLGNFLDKKRAELEKAKADLKAAEKEASELLQNTEKRFVDAEKEFTHKMRQKVASIQKGERNKIVAIRNKLKTSLKK